jgi:hypothetical protein
MRFRPFAVVLLSVVGACGSFGEDDSGGDTNAPDGAPPADGATAADGSTVKDGSTTATIRCGNVACPASKKCCLPLDTGNAGCVDRGAVCGAGFGELLCSSPAVCNANEVCCVTVERNSGQVAFDITRSFCVAATACPDQKLQHSLCDLGSSDQCPGKACKPYVHDINDQQQDLDVNPSGYATCQ